MNKTTFLVLATLLVLSLRSWGSSPEPVTRVVGGTPVEADHYPWLVSLHKKEQVLFGAYYWHFCGASQISSEWIVTAAHCLYDNGFNAEDVFAVVGKLDINRLNAADFLVIDQIIVHPGYDQNATWDQDIALLHLASPNELSSYAKIATNSVMSSLSSDQELTVAGWGTVDNDNSEPDTLLEANLNFVTNDACQQFWRGYEITDNMMCADGGGVTDACSGDSGGPLLYRDENGVLLQVGIVSWGNSECATQGSPSVFTRLSQYRGWISQYSQQLSLSSPNDFGLLPAGQSQTRVVTLNHRGSGSVDLYSAMVLGDAFELLADDCSGLTLRPEEQCQYTIRYQAGAFGTESGTLRITSSNGSLESELKGESAQTLALSLFQIPSNLLISSNVSLNDTALELSTTNEGVLFIQALQAGELTLDISLKGTGEQYLIQESLDEVISEIIDGQVEHEIIRIQVERDQIVRFEYSGGEDEASSFAIHRIEFTGGELLQPSVMEALNQSEANSGGGAMHWIMLWLFGGILACRLYGFKTPDIT